MEAAAGRGGEAPGVAGIGCHQVSLGPDVERDRDHHGGGEPPGQEARAASLVVPVVVRRRARIVQEVSHVVEKGGHHQGRGRGL